MPYSSSFVFDETFYSTLIKGSCVYAHMSPLELFQNSLIAATSHILFKQWCDDTPGAPATPGGHVIGASNRH